MEDTLNRFTSQEQDGLTWEIYQQMIDTSRMIGPEIAERKRLFYKFIDLVKPYCAEDLPIAYLAQMVFDLAKNASKGSKSRQKVEQVTGALSIDRWKEIVQVSKDLDSFVSQNAQLKPEMPAFQAPVDINAKDLEYLAGCITVHEDLVVRLQKPPVIENRAPPNEIDDAKWLLNSSDAHAINVGSALSGAELAKSIIIASQNSGNEQELQGNLFDIIGVEGFDFLQQVVARSSSLKKVTVDVIDALVMESNAVPIPSPSAAQYKGPSVVSSVTIQTESEKLAGKQRRKRDKKDAAAREGQGGETNWLEQARFDPSALRRMREESLQNAPNEPSTSALIEAFGMLEGGFVTDSGLKKALPEGTVRTKHKGFEKVVIPPPKVKGKAGKTDLIPIATLSPFGQEAFKGITHLNRLQSELFQTAYHTGENLLVCAPTGAGKTNVAMLTILHAFERMTIDTKVIYVAPMKALAQEVVTRFSKRLAPLRLKVAELTGDMQMTKKEIDQTHIIVTTPEKWDVITRKSSDGTLVQQVKLLIIDEVHLLADSRGSVIETLVARTLRLVESSQSLIRIVGLSATLPNYEDVGTFLRVNPKRGLFHFDNSYRPVPLTQTFIGVTEKNRFKQIESMNHIVYEEALEAIRNGHQVMVFVHSRKETANTMRSIRELASQNETIDEFNTLDHKERSRFDPRVVKSRNKDLSELYNSGFGIHHAGMLRSDRTLSEQMFSAGVLRVLCCTATLAWGVNLPAHTVLIKGTQVYSSEKGGLMPLSMLDVMQIFGRAGRPQFDTSGDAIMVTTHAELAHYLGLLTRQMPIESSFIKALPDHLNAEIVSGTVTNLTEASNWLSYTYLYVRMLRNPMAYGITYEEKRNDPVLTDKRMQLLQSAVGTLDATRMARLDSRSGNLAITNLGRVASHYYIHHNSIRTFNEKINGDLSDPEIFGLICSSTEFEQIKVRDDELKELDKVRKSFCPLEIKGGMDSPAGKANILLQAYISQARVTGFTLISDTNYISQNAGRVTRALFEIARKKNWPHLTFRLLAIAKSIDQRVWWFQTPLRQFKTVKYEQILKLESKQTDLYDLTEKDIGPKLYHLIGVLPCLAVPTVNIQPITRNVLRIAIEIEPDFEWMDKYHGTVEPYWIWIEDCQSTCIFHSEPFLLQKKLLNQHFELTFTVPLFETNPSQYVLKIVSDKWVGVETIVPISLNELVLPDIQSNPYTDLLNLRPLPKSALKNPIYEAIYSNFSYFNPIQTQLFHTLYHLPTNVLLGAPTGSGKTVCCELAMMQLWNTNPSAKTVYIAPLKALSRERVADWKRKFANFKAVVELTGDSAPDRNAIKRANILVTTPEKWDGITRSWRSREYVQAAELVIIDEIHLLGEDRGPVLEMIVSRMRYISAQTSKPCRIVGLSTALANASDLGEWLGVEKNGLFNFRPSVRPVPMEVHIQGFPGRHYCPRMATMNKPAFASIQQFSPTKPVLIFVSSRRQTRLTALDLISYCASHTNPKQFLHMDEAEIEYIVAENIQDKALQHTLAFGIGIHHAGLPESDRQVVESLFCNGKIQILVCTSTLAWGVNFPAHLVIVKGTEYFDGKVGRYVDFPVTDVLQMMGRAGRPQFDTKAVACIFVEESKKNFYKKFLYEPFPVESSLHKQLHNHINADVATGRIQSLQDAVEYLTWTYYFRRLIKNPSYYGTDAEETLNTFILAQLRQVLMDLETHACIESTETGFRPTYLGKIASFYYLNYQTVHQLETGLSSTPNSEAELLKLISSVSEFAELPVRHNEELLNASLAEHVTHSVDDFTSPHSKANLLLQARMERVKLPISDYLTDTKSVLDQLPRIINAIIDIGVELRQFHTIRDTIYLYRKILHPGRSELMQLPQVKDESEASTTLQSYLSTRRSMPSVTRRVCEALPSMEISQLRVNGSATVECQMTCTAKRFDPNVYFRYPSKAKKHGFYLLVESEGQLLAFDRGLYRKGRQNRKMDLLQTPKDEKAPIHLHLIYDSIRGLDQSDINFYYSS